MGRKVLRANNSESEKERDSSIALSKPRKWKFFILLFEKRIDIGCLLLSQSKPDSEMKKSQKNVDIRSKPIPSSYGAVRPESDGKKVIGLAYHIFS